MPERLDLSRYARRLAGTTPIVKRGKVAEVVGLVIEGRGLDLPVGAVCDVVPELDARPVPCEVVGFREGRTLMMAHGIAAGVRPRSLVTPRRSAAAVKVGPGLLGRVIDGLGRPIDGRGPLAYEAEYPLYAEPLNPLHRPRIEEALDVGVRAINGLLTLGKGQRIGIFSGSGVGKSTMMGMIARHTRAEVSVIGLIGERGREVNDFLDRDLGPEGLARSVVVVATSDQPALVRMRGAYLATAVAEYFRDQGADVVFMMDSITRYAMSAREVGLSVGEPPTTKGYTPSLFAQLPRLLERAGTKAGVGSITGVYTVLVEGDDLSEPVADAMRSILDGHIILSRSLADRGHYPSIEILGSISRLMPEVNPAEHLRLVRRFIKTLAVYRDAEDLINIGAYSQGSNEEIDEAIRLIKAVNDYLTQPVDRGADLESSRAGLADLFR
ncbi:MAG: FliI/YscN family ATPase [Proteobacteria bacterium]|nr:FliI/YscN family ATPase [Pseudomonadota bacterium]